jgi:hypothetical protein
MTSLRSPLPAGWSHPCTLLLYATHTHTRTHTHTHTHTPHTAVRRGTRSATSRASPTGTGPASRRCGWGGPSSCGASARACPRSTASTVGAGTGLAAAHALAAAWGLLRNTRRDRVGRASCFASRAALPRHGPPRVPSRHPACEQTRVRANRAPSAPPRAPGDLRDALYREVDKFVAALGGRDFLGGSAPNLADLSAYGVLRAVQGTPTYNDVVAYTKVRTWLDQGGCGGVCAH